MGSKMLIDATHPEETRVVVVRGNRIEEFDFESAARRQLKGNIYLAKVTRVEPSLQAAFVDYGGNRHGFLAFSEIHPDYYQIPIADRQALLEAEAEDARRGEEEFEAQEREGAREGAREARGDSNGQQDGNHRRRGRGRGRGRAQRREGPKDDAIASEALDLPGIGEQPVFSGAALELADEIVDQDVEVLSPIEASLDGDDFEDHSDFEDGHIEEIDEDDLGDEEISTLEDGIEQDEIIHYEDDEADAGEVIEASEEIAPIAQEETAADEAEAQGEVAASEGEETADASASIAENGQDEEARAKPEFEAGEEAESIESVGAEDAMEELPAPRRTQRRHYKIQEVIKRRQVILVQVVKEERGNKGAALTTYLSLAGRYCVLMPNSGRGGGVSRKITDPSDRRRLKELAREVEVPEGMGLIVRTAGAQRTKVEIKRDFDYLLRLWESVRDLTLSSQAPALVYEEGSLIKRAIRDLYSKDVDEVLVEGEDGLKEAKDFMKMLMPSHARNVKPWRETRTLFSRYGVEGQLDGLFSPTVTLPSGGYMVMNQTEALVAVDINSGKATREHNIEDTAYKTNLEACDEIARQLRLRDLAGLIVIDFIDMEEKRNNRNVERRLKDALKNDRARIQVGRISHFGLLEMSRQRLRQGMLEGSSKVCPHCEGRGVVRSVASCALSVLRQIEDQLNGRRAENLTVHCHREIANYILNEKREHLLSIEAAYGVSVFIVSSDHVKAAEALIERGADRPLPVRKRPEPVVVAEVDAEVEVEEPTEDTEEEEVARADMREANDELDEDGEPRRRRRRRRGRRGGRRNREEFDGDEEGSDGIAASETSSDEAANDEVDAEASADASQAPALAPSSSEDDGDEDRPQRRRRRGGRGRRSRNDEAAEGENEGETRVSAEIAEPIGEPEPLVVAEASHEAAPRQPVFAVEAQAEVLVPASQEMHVEAMDETKLEVAEERRWQPPAPTVDPEQAPRKTGWWSKR